MSERMIEIMRAKMRLTTAAAPTPNATNSLPLMQQQDKNLQTFLHLLSSQPHFTVPTSLSRRILQQQGVDYLDENVAAITSLAADRFLATVLHQAMACRDRRIKGEDLLKTRRKEERLWRKRKRSEMEDRNERRKERDEKKKQKLLADIKKADTLHGEKTQGNAGGGGSKKKRSKKGKNDTSGANGDTGEKKSEADGAGNDKADPNALSATNNDGNDDDLSDNSLDDDEHIQSQFLDYDSDGESSDDEEEEDEEDEEKRFVLKLRDLQRPLEAWGFNLAGKLGLGEPYVEIEKKPEDPDNRDVDTSDLASSQHINMDTDGNSVMGDSATGVATSTVSSKKGDKSKSDASDTRKKSSNASLGP